MEGVIAMAFMLQQLKTKFDQRVNFDTTGHKGLGPLELLPGAEKWITSSILTHIRFLLTTIKQVILRSTMKSDDTLRDSIATICHDPFLATDRTQIMYGPLTYAEGDRAGRAVSHENLYKYYSFPPHMTKAGTFIEAWQTQFVELDPGDDGTQTVPYRRAFPRPPSHANHAPFGYEWYNRNMKQVVWYDEQTMYDVANGSIAFPAEWKRTGPDASTGNYVDQPCFTEPQWWWAHTMLPNTEDFPEE